MRTSAFSLFLFTVRALRQMLIGFQGEYLKQSFHQLRLFHFRFGRMDNRGFFSLFRWDRAVLPVYNRCRIFFAQKRALEYGL